MSHDQTQANPPGRPSVRWVAFAAVDVPAWRAASKNTTRQPWGGRMRTPRPTAALRSQLRLLVGRSLGDRRLVPGATVWVAVHVRRADLRGDPANCLELVLDAVKEAVDVDDRYHAVWGVTWDLDRKQLTRISVWVGEEAVTQNPSLG